MAADSMDQTPAKASPTIPAINITQKRFAPGKNDPTDSRRKTIPIPICMMDTA
jgi:hypothetical protein